jgi:hypothetical protein
MDLKFLRQFAVGSWQLQIRRASCERDVLRTTCDAGVTARARVGFAAQDLPFGAAESEPAMG